MTCPGCDLELPEEDLRAQVEHMEAEHPEIVAARLEAAGFRRDGDRWIDTLA